MQIQMLRTFHLKLIKQEIGPQSRSECTPPLFSSSTTPKAQTMRFATNPISLPFALLCAFLAMPSVQAGPIMYGICQTGCNALAVACYAAAGFTFGTVIAAPAAPAIILVCNASLGTCSAACAAVTLLAPTP